MNGLPGDIRRDQNLHGIVEIRKIKETMKEIEKKMMKAAQDLRFEEAAEYRDEIKRLKRVQLAVEDEHDIRSYRPWIHNLP